MKYALLIYGPEVSQEDIDPAEAQQVMAEYAAFSERITTRDINKGGEALHETASATTVRVRDGETLATDGPFAETKEALGGFYLVDVADLDEAIEVAAQIPGARTGSVEIRPVWVWENDYEG